MKSNVPHAPTITDGGRSPLVNGKTTYTSASYSAYYTIEDNTIIYTAEEGDEENKIVTLFKTVLGTDNVMLEGDDYSLALDSNIVQEPSRREKKFTSLTNITATFKIFGDNE